MPDPNEELSLGLVRRIQGGDLDAWEALYRRYHDVLLFSVRARLGPRLREQLESEDILQSVVKDALRDLGQFEPRGPGSLRHWLHACVLNKIRVKAEYHEAGVRGGMAPLLEPEQVPEAAPEYLDGERFGALETGLAQLPVAMREVVLLRAIEDLSNQEAAQVLGRSPEATSKLYNRALARLGTTLEPGDSS